MDKENLTSNVTVQVPQLTHINDNKIETKYTGIIRIDWKSHLLWFLSVACFILSRLWWLIPLPGDTFLPSYRTYPATFLNNVFLAIACGLASRSLPIGLVQKPFTNGIHPNSVIEYGSTGGYAAMWSGIRYRSGLRYFLLASLVTAATLLGNALEGELQSSVTIHYMPSNTLSNMNAIECQHVTAGDYQAASNAYQNMTHTLSDAPPSILNNPEPFAYSIALYKTTLTPIHNISLSGISSALQKRHSPSKTTCTDQEETATSSSDAIKTTTTTTTSSPTSTPTFDTTLYQPESYAALSLDGHEYALNVSDFNNATLLTVLQSPDGFLAASTSASAIKLNVISYTTSDQQEAIIIYSSPSDGIIAGAYISGYTSNYTCQSSRCYPSTTEPIHNRKVVSNALVQAILSDTGYFGTSVPDSLVLNILNNKHDRIQEQSQLVDAVFMNSNCPASSIVPSQGYLVMPYSAAHWTILGIIWIALFAIVYLIGAYLIGYTEESWSQLVRTGHMIPQLIHNSNNLFKDGDIVDQVTYLDQSTAKFSFVREHHHGYTVTSEEVYAL